MNAEKLSGQPDWVTRIYVDAPKNPENRFYLGTSISLRAFNHGKLVRGHQFNYMLAYAELSEREGLASLVGRDNFHGGQERTIWEGSKGKVGFYDFSKKLYDWTIYMKGRFSREFNGLRFESSDDFEDFKKYIKTAKKRRSK